MDFYRFGAKVIATISDLLIHLVFSLAFSAFLSYTVAMRLSKQLCVESA